MLGGVSKSLFKIFLGYGGKRFMPEEAGFRITSRLAGEVALSAGEG